MVSISDQICHPAATSSESSRSRSKRRERRKPKGDEHIVKKIKLSVPEEDTPEPPKDDSKQTTAMPQPPPVTDTHDLREAQEFKAAVQGGNVDSDDDDDEDMEPPSPNPIPPNPNPTTPDSIGKALFPGEGEALTAYVQQNLRIPRCGEIARLQDIEHWESSGFVMPEHGT